ncbi:uncharacterized protein BKCO1_4000097 [Diplodia corticola]|uniref:Uncharacterized protein n=1 Tax=Diplodia corticola TaxID=236234 RepID=A0A1J9QTD8_9PEZI|nr:uncharacterized protein BKCO1_4000097 [Diplodia corticola]OJD32238.1 hypothetical protein BKCO1_4000097 [Diplodia corticola]
MQYRLGLSTLLLAAIVGASPLDTKPFEYTEGYQLQADDLIVPIEGVPYVMKESTYVSQLKAQGISIGAPELNPEWITADADELSNDVAESEHSLESRQADCDSTFSIVTDKTETFVDWDVQMSPVVCAVGDMDVTVSSGYSVANTAGGSAGVDLKFLKDKLTTSLGINFSRTWTTQTSILTKGTVKDGNCGVLITQPIVTRRSGRQFRGCVGATTETGTWYADSHNDGSYNGIEWIEGATSMCTKPGRSPPLSRCNGQGNFV